MKIREVCEMNQLSINSDIKFDTYLYLDTSNLFENSVDKVETFNDKESLPSRAKRLVRKNDILFSTIRPNQNHYGILENPPNNLLVSTGFAVITAKKDKVNPYYLYYFLTKEKNVKKLQMIAETAVSSYPSIRPNDIGNLNIQLPSIEKQNEIVEDLHFLEEKVKLNSKLINYLEDYSQMLFYKWFVEFNFPDDNGNPYNDFGGEMKIVNGKELPIGWDYLPLEKLVKINTESVNPQDYPDKEFKHYSIPAFDESKTYANELGSEIKSNKYKVNYNNLLVSKLNPWFKRVVYPMNVDNAICSTEFVVWNPEMEKHLEFLYVLAKTSKFTRYCTIASTGTSNSHKRIKPEFMLKFKVPYNTKIITKFNELIKPIIEKIHIARQENKIFEETKELLIKKLIK